MDVTWEDPPKARRAPGATTQEEVELVATLRQNPDRWARFREYEGSSGTNRAANLASNIRNGRRAAFVAAASEDGEFEAVSRLVDGKRIVYVRYATLNND